VSASAARVLPDPAADPRPAGEGAVRVGRNFVYRIGSQAVSAVVNVAAMILLGRALGAEGYGDYAYWYALIPLLSNLAGAGIGIVVTREIARDPDVAPRLIGDAILVRLAFGALVLGAVLLAGPQLKAPGETLLLLVVAAAALFDFGQDVSIWVLRAHERLDLEALLLLVSQVVWLGLIVGAIVLQAGLVALLGAAVVAFVVRTAVGWWILTRRFHRPRFSAPTGRLFELVREGLPFGLALFGVVLYGRIGLLTLKNLATTLDVSYFQVGYLLSQPFTFVATALAMAMFPNLARRAQAPSPELRASLRRALKCQVLMGLPLTLGLVLLAEPLIALLFQDKAFDAAATALRILSLGLTVIFLNHAARYALAALDRQRDYLVAVGLGIVVNAVLCAMLVPGLGFVGACLAFLAAELAIWVVCQHALAAHVHPAEVARDAFRPVAAAGVAALWLLALHAAPPLLAALAAAITYVLFLWWTRALTPGELRVLRRIVLSFVSAGHAPRPASRWSP
jgi:O-antigen/teichoic acid export membrane protein